MLSVVDVEAGTDTVRYASYAAIPLFVLGMVGNGIMIRLMIKREVRQYSSSIFLLGLAITDTVVLVYEVMDDIAIHLSNYTSYDILFGYNPWRCRFGVFFYQTARTVSAWLIVGMAAELCIAATSAKRRKVVYNRNRTMYVSMAIVLVAIAAGFPFLVLTQQSTPEMEMPTCTSVYEVFFLVYSEFVLKGATQCLFPVLFIFICNVVSFVSMSSLKAKKLQESKYVSMIDRRGMTKKPTQANNTIYALTFLYILSVTPATVAEVMIMVERFFADFYYTWFWSILINVTGVLFMANYALKFYFIVLFGKEYRGAFAGKLNLYDDSDEEEQQQQQNGPIANGVIANGGYDVRHY
jgi:hypothetical protein